VLAVRIGDGFP
jgi:hypothetical protein